MDIKQVLLRREKLPKYVYYLSDNVWHSFADIKRYIESDMNKNHYKCVDDIAYQFYIVEAKETLTINCCWINNGKLSINIEL